jgi:hypothetical protein
MFTFPPSYPDESEPFIRCMDKQTGWNSDHFFTNYIMLTTLRPRPRPRLLCGAGGLPTECTAAYLGLLH